MSFISRLRRSRLHRVSILSAYLVHPFPLRGTSPQGETRALRDWLSVSYGMISTLVISRYAAPPFPLRGTVPHPGDRIKRSMLSCRDMIPLLSIHSAPACGGKVVASATKGGIAGVIQGAYEFSASRLYPSFSLEGKCRAAAKGCTRQSAVVSLHFHSARR